MHPGSQISTLVFLLVAQWTAGWANPHIGSFKQLKPNVSKRSIVSNVNYAIQLEKLGDYSKPPHFRNHQFADKRQKKSISDFIPKNAEKITECMTVSSEIGGVYYYESDGRSQPCGLYAVGKPDTKVKLTIQNVDIGNDCDKEVLVLVDGWELNGSVFPSERDHPTPTEERFTEVCGGPDANGRSLVSSQNAALLQFLLPVKGNGFIVTVEYIPHPDPCNILMSDMMGMFQITNDYGKSRNCSLTTLLFPATFAIMDLSVGEQIEKRSIFERQTGVTRHCSSYGSKDFVEFGGSSQLSTDLDALEDVCGFQPKPFSRGLTVMCGSSTVRLVSSGNFENSITVYVSAATEQDLKENNNYILTCPK